MFKNSPQHISVVKNNFVVGGIKGNLNGSWHMLWLVTKRRKGNEWPWLKELPGTKKPNPCNIIGKVPKHPSEKENNELFDRLACRM